MLDIPCWILDIQFLEKPEHRSEAGLNTEYFFKLDVA